MGYTCRAKEELTTAVERVSRCTRLGKFKRRPGRASATQIRKRLGSLVKVVQTITSDNGKEFGDHVRFSSVLHCDFYFGEPYSPWQQCRQDAHQGQSQK